MRVLSSMLAGICTVMFSIVGAFAVTVSPSNQQGNTVNVTVTNSEGHATAVDTTVEVFNANQGKYVVSMDPPYGGP